MCEIGKGSDGYEMRKERSKVWRDAKTETKRNYYRDWGTTTRAIPILLCWGANVE